MSRSANSSQANAEARRKRRADRFKQRVAKRNQRLAKQVEKYGFEPPYIPCSKKQAIALMDEVGFKKGSPSLVIEGRGGKKHRRTVSVSNLQLVFSQEHAGALIREHRLGKNAQAKTSWKISTPKRDVLGIGDVERRLILSKLTYLIAKYARVEFGTVQDVNGKQAMDQHYG